jgi:Mrp family chromosome partitioning ATPase
MLAASRSPFSQINQISSPGDALVADERPEATDLPTTTPEQSSQGELSTDVQFDPPQQHQSAPHLRASKEAATASNQNQTKKVRQSDDESTQARSVDDANARTVAIHASSEINAPHIAAKRFAVGGVRKTSDEYQQAGKNILAALPVATTPTILFASADAPYNSATVMCNLAAALTEQSESSVLAIDATPQATLTKELGIQRTGALMRLVRGAAHWKECIVQTPAPGLCLLPTREGSDRIAPFAFQKLLGELKSYFGLILIDAGAFDQGTSLSLTGVCSAAYLTLRLNHTTKDRARSAERLIKASGGNLAGSLLVYSSPSTRD